MNADQCRRRVRRKQQRTGRLEAGSDVAVGNAMNRNANVLRGGRRLDPLQTEAALHRIERSRYYANAAVPGVNQDSGRG